MNIVEALNVALPELPPDAGRLTRLPRLEPSIVAREQRDAGRNVVQVLAPRTGRYYTITPDQWVLLQLFDGERSYQEIAELYAARTGSAYSPEWFQEFAEQSQDADFWFHSPQERNRALWQKLKDERRQRVKQKSKYGDLAEITFSAWDPDKFLTVLNQKLSFIFTPWFLLLNLALFAFAAFLLGSHFGEVIRDNLEIYNFTDKSGWEIAQFWIIVCIIGFIHECSHGLVCKHIGGEVHRLGFLLIYLSPCFFCDTTQAWVYGGKWRRILTGAAGMWSSLIICSLACLVWWGTPVGSGVHNTAYLTILFSGILPVLINLNPLIKLDGYFIFTEMFDLGDLKENSTAFVNNWTKRHIFRLPVEVPYASRRRKLLYVPYTFFSALYSYGLLYYVVIFADHVFRSFSPEWGFVPAVLLAFKVFKSRIRGLLKFMKLLYLDKKDRIRALLHGPRAVALAAGALVLLFAPLWRETVQARFVLEPARRAVVRAQVAGMVVAAQAQEGETVAAGAPLLQLRNLSLESAAAQAQSDWQLASARALQAELHYRDYAAAQQQREQMAEQSRVLRAEVSQLMLNSPIPGVVVTARVQDLVGTHMAPGTPAVEVDELQTLRARGFLPELSVRHIHPGSPAALLLDNGTGIGGLQVASLAEASSQVEPGLMKPEAYKGMQGTQFYPVAILVPNRDGKLRAGLTGTAKIFVRRRSLAGFSAQAVYDFICRKIW